MNFVDLANNYTVRLVLVHYIYCPTRIVDLQFVLYPTVNKAFTSEIDLLRCFAMSWSETMGGEDLAVVNAIIGKSTADVLDAIVAQWNVFQADGDVPSQLVPLFKYVESVGLAP